MTAWSEIEARDIVQAQRDLRGPLLPALRALQAHFGCIDSRAVAVVADVLNVSRAEVHGVATFYRDFRATPAGAVVVRICRAEACQALGSARVEDHARRRLGVDFGDTTDDGSFTLDEVFCLGNCARGPSVIVDGRLFGDVNPDRLDALLAAAEGMAGAGGAWAAEGGAGRAYRGVWAAAIVGDAAAAGAVAGGREWLADGGAGPAEVGAGPADGEAGPAGLGAGVSAVAGGPGPADGGAGPAASGGAGPAAVVGRSDAGAVGGDEAAAADSVAVADAVAVAGGAGPAATVGRRVVTVFVPGDSAARAVGADEVAAAIGRAGGRDVRIVRNGSRGMAWLEPLVEVATEHGRMGYGPVTVEDVAGLFEAGFLEADGGAHRLFLGSIDDHPWLAAQERLTFARVGVIDPLDADDFVAHGGLAGLRRALSMSPEEIVAEVTDSGLRGRGGAGFPTGIKWRTVLACPADQKFICANADEGDSGTFADRMLMEGDPFSLIEGMLIAGLAVGATEGYVYIRSEYPDAVAMMDAAVQEAYHRGWLGPSVIGSGRSFDVFLRVGAGAYICGEETAMLESLEGKRGVVRAKPPLPAIAGLFGRPTVVNNVLTLATVPAVLAGGAESYQRHGVGRSRGTQVFQLAGNVAHGGIVEAPFGITLGQLVNEYGGGTASGRPARAVQVGGPLGAYVPEADFDRPMDYEAFAAAGAIVGHGGIVVFDDTVDMAQQARFAMEFCAAESCGKCTPCRVGAVRGVEVIDRIRAADGDESRQAQLSLLDDLCELMTSASLCAMGGLTPLPIRSALQHFREDFSHQSARMARDR